MISKIKTQQLLQIFVALLIILFVVSGKGILTNKNDSGSMLSIATGIQNFCRDNLNTYGSKETCYSQKFKEIGKQNGPDYSFKVLDSLQQIDPDSIGCHLIAHGIGWGSFEWKPGDWRNIIQNMRTTCNYGAIHGVIESYINSLPDKSLKRDVIPTICGENPRADCNHIIGHLLLVETDANVPKALDLCNVFGDAVQKDFCLTGVFMEQETALNLVAHELVPRSWLNWPARLDELEKMCRSYTGENASACWQEIVHVALAKFNNDPKLTWDFCNTAQVQEGARRCVRHSIGIIGASKNFDLPSLKSMCSIPQKDDPTFEEECYPDLVSSALSTIPTMVPQAVSFCDGLDSKFKPSCFSMIGLNGYANPVVKSQLQNACSVIAPDLQKYCLGLSSSMNTNLSNKTSTD